MDKEWYINKLRFYAPLVFLYARRKTEAMQGIGEAFQRSRKEK